MDIKIIIQKRLYNEKLFTPVWFLCPSQYLLNQNLFSSLSASPSPSGDNWEPDLALSDSTPATKWSTMSSGYPALSDKRSTPPHFEHSKAWSGRHVFAPEKGEATPLLSHSPSVRRILRHCQRCHLCCFIMPCYAQLGLLPTTLSQSGAAWTYLIFVICFTRAKFLENKIYTEKTRKLRQNTQ